MSTPRRRPNYKHIMGLDAKINEAIENGQPVPMRLTPCPVHGAIYEHCLKYLAHPGLGDGPWFQKEQVLIDLGYQHLADSIIWDYIARRIQEGTDPENPDDECEIIPLTEAFFNRQCKIMRKALRDKLGLAKDEQVTADHWATYIARVPGRFMAGGHGRRTFGYCAVTEDTAGLTIVWRNRFKSQADGLTTRVISLDAELKRKAPKALANLALKSLGTTNI